jgi:Fe-S cluster biosynthesis and repair protein YggX
MARTVQCVYLKKEADGLDFVPYPGELGKRLYANVSKEAWALADQRARQYLARQMERYFFGEGVDQPAGYVPPAA